jgi:hypothetical protein
MKTKFIESVVRTNRLSCSACGNRIKKGTDALFELYEGRMENVFCEGCSVKFGISQDYEDTRHPFDLEELK